MLSVEILKSVIFCTFLLSRILCSLLYVLFQQLFRACYFVSNPGYIVVINATLSLFLISMPSLICKRLSFLFYSSLSTLSHVDRVGGYATWFSHAHELMQPKRCIILSWMGSRYRSPDTDSKRLNGHWTFLKGSDGICCHLPSQL